MPMPISTMIPEPITWPSAMEKTSQNPSDFFSSTLSPPSNSDLRERGVEVGHQVFRILEPGGHPDHALRDAHLLTLFLGDVEEGHRRRYLCGRAHGAETCGETRELQVIE